jgi:hypothetical protein
MQIEPDRSQAQAIRPRTRDALVGEPAAFVR